MGLTRRQVLRPTDVLAAIKAVDGTGSGLDADLLQGIPGSSYALKSETIPEAPDDGKQYGRQSESWTEITGGGGSGDHTQLTNRDAADQHPIEAITGLDENFIGIANALETLFDRLSVYDETSTSTAVRAATIPGITRYDDILNIPIYIKAATYGASSSPTLNINGLGVKQITFPNLTGGDLNLGPLLYWVREGGIYCVVYNGSRFVLLNQQVMEATVSYRGVVRLNDDIDSTSITTAATANSVRQAYEKATSTLVSATLTAAGWTGSAAPYSQVLSVNGVTATSVNEIILSSAPSIIAANIQDGGQSANQITLRAYGVKPTVNNPIKIIVRRDL